jgi:tRNA dimethylallyltransferase
MAHPLPTLVIGGPTASGKSSLALRLAERTGAEIIGADAFQVYRGLPILTAQPDAEFLSRAPHHLVGELDPVYAFDVVQYLALARERIAAVRARGKPAVLVGGTGLYIRAVLNGLSDDLPPPQPQLRATMEQTPLAELVRQLLERDPSAEYLLDLRNPRRVMRALEVCVTTGRPFTSYRKTADPADARVIRGVWVSVPRAELHGAIVARTDEFFARGVVEEVRSANDGLGPTARQAIGVGEIRHLLRGEISEADARRLINEATRQYARRQETWFRREPALVPSPASDALEACLRIMDGSL